MEIHPVLVLDKPLVGRSVTRHPFHCRIDILCITQTFMQSGHLGVLRMCDWYLTAEPE